MTTELTYTSDESQAPTAEHGVTVNSGFGSQSVARIAETSSTALAAQAQAAVQARYVMAMQRPRVLARVRASLMADCKRPAFADSAIYRKPVGEGVEGPSIRMAEAAARAMTNILAESASIYDDAEKRIMRVCATDLEANVTFPLDVTIAKTIERSRPMPGRKIVGERKNSRGGTVYIIEATDDEILDKERALVSKALRTCLLRLIPGDILEEAIEQCYRTRDAAIRSNLPESRAKMVSVFESVGVNVAQLAEYIGHALSDVTSEEIAEMRSLFRAIKDKETTWAEAAEHRRATANAANADVQPTTLADKLAAKAAEVAKTKTQAPESN